MASSSSPSAPPIEGRDELLRRFVEASLRARIVSIVNRADSERELGELITAELCEAFEAEIAFVFASGEDGAFDLVGAYGLQPGEAVHLFDHELCRRLLVATEPTVHRGDDLLGLGIRNLVAVPFGPGQASSASHDSTRNASTRQRSPCSTRSRQAPDTRSTASV